METEASGPALDETDLERLRRGMRQVVDATVKKLQNKADAKEIVSKFGNLKQETKADDILLESAERIEKRQGGRFASSGAAALYTGSAIGKSLQNAVFTSDVCWLLSEYAASGSLPKTVPDEFKEEAKSDRIVEGAVPKDLRKRVLNLGKITQWRRVAVLDEQGSGKALEREKNEELRLGTVAEASGTRVPCSFRHRGTVVVLQALVPQGNAPRWKTVVFSKKDADAVLHETWAHPGKAAFRGVRSTWARVFLDWIGIKEKDIQAFLSEQEARQISKAPRVQGILTPIMPEDIGWWQMDLIIVKYEKRIKQRALAGGETKEASAELREGTEETELSGGAHGKKSVYGDRKPKPGDTTKETVCEVKTYRVLESESIAGGAGETVKISKLSNVAEKDVADVLRATERKEDYTAILTVIDLFSKYLWAFPIRVKDATTIAARLESLFLVEGAPRILQSDNGGEFLNKYVSALSKRFNVDRRLCRPYNSQCDGVIERLNRTLQEALTRSMYEYSNNDWWEMLPLVVYGYNTAKHTTTGLSPFLVHRGREPQTLGNVTLFTVPELRDARAAAAAEAAKKQVQKKVALPLEAGEGCVVETLTGGVVLGGGAVPDPRLPAVVNHKAREESFRVQARAFYKATAGKKAETEGWGDRLADVAFKPLTDVLFDGKPPQISPTSPPEAVGEPRSVRKRDGTVEIVCDSQSPCTFQTTGVQIRLGSSVAPTDETSMEASATLLLAEREKRRIDVFHRIRDKAVKMVEKSVEKHKAAKGFERISPSDLELDTRMKEALTGRAIRPDQELGIVKQIKPTTAAARVRLSRLFFTQARAEEKAGFRRPSAHVQNWSEYTFRVIATSPLILDAKERYPRQYWLRLEPSVQPGKDESEALFGAQKEHRVVLVDRQYLLPIPIQTTATRGERVLTQTAFLIEGGPLVAAADRERQVDLIAQGEKDVCI